MERFLPYIAVAATAFVVTFVCTPAAKRLAIRLDAVDYPSKRRINTQPTPRLGGLAVFLGLLVAMVVAVFGGTHLGWPPVLVSHPSLAVDYHLLAVAVLLMVATGTADDIVQLSPKAKFAGQIIAASVAVAGGLVIHQIVNPFAGDTYIELGWLAYPITVIYLAAFTNIINLIDGLDGLASGISCIAALSMFSFAILAGRHDAAAFSLLLGFSLGIISLLNVSRTAAVTSLLIPLIVAGVPIIDTFSAIIRRTRAHVSIGQADKGHIHHRLIQEGYNQKQAVLLIYAWCILLSLGAAAINQVGVIWRVLIFLALLACSAAFAIHLHLFEPVLRHHYNADTHEDEIVTPDDPAFADEEATAEAKHPRHQKKHRNRNDRRTDNR